MFTSINPANQEAIFTINEFSESEVTNAIQMATSQFEAWKKESIISRIAIIKRIAVVLSTNAASYAEIITLEMGKPIKQAIAEVEKCAVLCEYYAGHAEGFLSDRSIDLPEAECFVSYEPLGVILGVMPWNYPFWQAFRFAIPTLLAGNTIVLKHASNVMKCAQTIEHILLDSGLPEGCYINLPIKSDKIEAVIKNPNIKAVSLTGSESAGASVASVAAGVIKKAVLELGGSNALVVLEDCNLDDTVEKCVDARFQNAGQSCIAGKRLLVQDSIAPLFIEKFIQRVRNLKIGDAMDTSADIASMARIDLAEQTEKQMKESIAAGAILLCGGKRENAWFEPTVLSNITKEMPLFDQEVFGPVIGVMTFKTINEAIQLVNASRYGLGVSIFTRDVESLRQHIPHFQDGAVFVNQKVMSHPALPFGGTKYSGYGRELSAEGIHEFVNIKTIYVSKE